MVTITSESNHRFVLLGIGNELRGDDGVGPYIADNLQNPCWQAINCGTVPENFTGQIKELSPAVLVVVDAAKMGLSPGEYRVLPMEHRDTMITSTHSIPLTVTLSYLQEYVGQTMLLGVEPEEINNSTDLSPKVKLAAQEIIELLEESRFDSIDILD